jgi:hypothetical protein
VGAPGSPSGRPSGWSSRSGSDRIRTAPPVDPAPAQACGHHPRRRRRLRHRPARRLCARRPSGGAPDAG